VASGVSSPLSVIAFDSEHKQCQLMLRSEVPREWLEDYLSNQDAE
jgi:uncharacterized protein YheU (UPF0270 family)